MYKPLWSVFFFIKNFHTVEHRPKMFFVQRTKYTNSGSLTTMRASSARTFFEWPQKLLYIMSVNMLDSFRIFATGSISAPFLPPQSHTMPMPYNQPLYLTCRVFTDIYLERANVTMNSNAPAKFWHPIAMPAVTSTLIHIYHTGELTNNVATWIFHLRMLFFYHCRIQYQHEGII